MRILKLSHGAEIKKGRTLAVFLTYILLQISKNWRGPFEDIEIFRKIGILNSLIVQKNVKGATIWALVTANLSQNIKKGKKLKGTL